VFALAYRELVAVPRALVSPRSADDKPSARIALAVGDFAPKVEYVPFEQGSRILRRQLKKPALLDVPSDEKGSSIPLPRCFWMVNS
jgi:hypothetical protein